ncbi:DNA recombination protein RmuC [bacterium]|jgi:DNA recombination protein RmuC|nr:DNA recombination protein RmuC [bacterium]MBT3581976.1 DNA recombination protein RmuC [bacterium]MBT4551550.1 DNA recombination protein RmuC [bacterium]MBT5988186.1 DNA recombination protein RmuC [bacterium]MBT7088441.1 DNA recombination protein RmuC [bacterium]
MEILATLITGIIIGYITALIGLKIATNQTQINTKDLDHKKEMIDRNLAALKNELEKVHNTMRNLEKDREQKFGELNSQLKFASDQTYELRKTTEQLNQALSNSKIRGQWGERMAEDILRLAGFIEGVNYLKQKALKGTRLIPDFTFMLPNNLILNMDVKFPLNNYLSFLECTNEHEKEIAKTQFLKDIKLRIKEVKAYILPEISTMDYALLFIPNEQIFTFLNEQGPDIIDNALKNKVIFCSPLTLYAILAVVRQAVDNFFVEKTAGKILALLSDFKKQWLLFSAGFSKIEHKLSDLHQDFLELTSKRKTFLEKPLAEIEDLRTGTVFLESEKTEN